MTYRILVFDPFAHNRLIWAICLSEAVSSLPACITVWIQHLEAKYPHSIVRLDKSFNGRYHPCVSS